LNPGRTLKPICEDLEFWGKRLEGGRLRIDMEMPGVDKKDISLEMRKNSFCVSAPRGQDTEYSGCFKFAHEIVPEKTETNAKVAFSKSSHRSRTGATEWMLRFDNECPPFMIKPSLFL
jgi:hypothetical protein